MTLGAVGRQIVLELQCRITAVVQTENENMVVHAECRRHGWDIHDEP